MNNDTCVFALTQIANEYACEHGELVTRRAGPDIACQAKEIQKKCECVYAGMKKAGLEAFDYEDDLTQVPHGVWVKIQFGGLMALTNKLNIDDSTRLENIAEVITAAERHYHQLVDIPYEEFVVGMKTYKARRRRK